MKTSLQENKINNSIVNNLYNSTPLIPPKLLHHNIFSNTYHQIIAKGDSGASRHYFTHNDAHILSNKSAPDASFKVFQPDGSCLTPQLKGHFSTNTTSSLTPKTTETHVLKGLKTSIISLGQLADDGCTINLTKNDIVVRKNGKQILQGHRNAKDGLWDIPIVKRNTEFTNHLNMIVHKKQSIKSLVQYVYACLFSPTKSTLLKAIENGNLISFPGMTTQNVKKYLEELPATALGHLDQERKNLQSTKQVLPTTDLNTNTQQSVKTLECFVCIENYTTKSVGYSDQTGRFPYTSSRGNEYVMVLYDYDSNVILAKALRNRQGQEIMSSWTSLYDTLEKKGIAPTVFILDNEASNDLKKAMIKRKIQYQLAPPNIHRRNAAERAIRTFKNHFLSGIATTDPAFPIHEWDRLIQQAVLTLNLLRNTRINPKLSSYAYIFGTFNFSATPLAPPGTRIVAHIKPDKRESWAYHGLDGWYVGPSMEHYRCVRCFFPESRRERDIDTLQFYPHKIEFPSVTYSDYLRQAAQDLLSAVKDKRLKRHIPNLHIWQCRRRSNH